MKQLLLQSKWHWFMFFGTLFYCFIAKDNSIELSLFWLTILSLIIGILIELFQYINHAKVKYKTVDFQYIKFALFDILITVFAGFLGSIFYNFLYKII
jgi:type III secretory pathway component EscS